ncbi:MAG: sigma-54-dependent Fis family transcriptional regulator, partial [Opitutaceae bacterium]|nr:sigma-54-dependent Fis family transcriptional regulator [Verrucomicrobiales bacterium]
ARITSGSFRQDLYFRLARYIVTTTPLRERSEDIALLAMHFLRMFASEMGLKAPILGREALVVLNDYEFPGNVRELRNIIERALIESGGELIQPDHLQLLHRAGPAASLPGRKARGETIASLPLNLAEAEDLLIQRALQETGGNIADAARLLGVHRTRIYRKLAQEESPASS